MLTRPKSVSGQTKRKLMAHFCHHRCINQIEIAEAGVESVLSEKNCGGAAWESQEVKSEINFV